MGGGSKGISGGYQVDRPGNATALEEDLNRSKETAERVLPSDPRICLNPTRKFRLEDS
jgi:hypothetical protein